MKPCRGCGQKKDVIRERVHYCSKCEKDPHNRSLILDSTCSYGHRFRESGYYVFGNKIRCKACMKHKAKNNWKNPTMKKRNQIAKKVSYMMTNYGITEEDWMTMYSYQNGLCVICKHPLNIIHQHEDGKRNAAVDHDHRTGLIRGLICRFPCNYTLGHLHDDVVLFRACADYLENPPSIQAFGKSVYTAPGKLHSKKRQKLIKNYREKRLQEQK